MEREAYNLVGEIEMLYNKVRKYNFKGSDSVLQT